MGFSFKTWSTGETLTASDLNAQFTKIENKLGNIKNADIAADAGITSAKLLDRYSAFYQTFVLRGIDVYETGAASDIDIFGDSGGLLVAEDVQSFASATKIRLDVMLPSKRAFLVGAMFHVTGYLAGATDDMTIWLGLNNTEVSSVDVTTTDTTYFMRAGSDGASAFSSPIAALSDGDYLQIAVGNQVATEVPRAQFITVTLVYKAELIS